MTNDDGLRAALEPCPLCACEPRRNGRGGAGGVLCDGLGKGVGMLHRVQTYGADQEEADRAWNRRATPAAVEPVAGGYKTPESTYRDAWDAVEAIAKSLGYSGLVEAIERLPPATQPTGDAAAIERAFRAGYEAALDHACPPGPIHYTGTDDDAWTEYSATLSAGDNPHGR